MDALLLARLQFAFTIGFHFLFPAMTLGVALIILISATASMAAAASLIIGFLMSSLPNAIAAGRGPERCVFRCAR